MRYLSRMPVFTEILLTGTVGAAGFGPPPPSPVTGSDIDKTTFAAFLDVLLPADDWSPSASELAVPEEIIDIAKAVEPFHRLITLACG